MVATQGNNQKEKITKPPVLNNTGTNTAFGEAMKESEVGSELNTTDRSYIKDNLHPNSKTRHLIMDDSLFVMQMANQECT